MEREPAYQAVDDPHYKNLRNLAPTAAGVHSKNQCTMNTKLFGMGARLVGAVLVAVLIAGTAGTAIALASGGFSDPSTPVSDQSVPEHVEHFLSPSDVDQHVDGTPVDVTQSDDRPDDSLDSIVPATEDADADIVVAVDQLNDTVGDGYPDAVLESVPPLAEHDPDPQRHNVFVEVDYMEGCDPSGAIEQTEEAFANAPVENPDGSTGIDFHVTRGKELPRSAVVTPRDTDLVSPPADAYNHQAFDRDGFGFHYVVFAHNAGPAAGFRADAETDTMVVECGSGDSFMHELGHALGISHEVPVVDSHDVDFEEYPSTMNYDRPDGFYGFSNGTASDIDHDDWGTIEAEMASYRPPLDRVNRSAFHVEEAEQLAARYDGVTLLPLQSNED